MRTCRSVSPRIAVAVSVLVATCAHGALAQRVETVSMGGRRVEIVRMGKGTPTLVLEGGAGDSAGQWNSIIADLAKLTRVVAYSRSGHGASSAATAPGSPHASVAELHALLRSLGEKAPVVLAGGSWGGLLARLYASTYPDEVAGLVLVDGSHEAQFVRWGALNPAFKIIDTVRAMAPRMTPATRADFAQMLAVMESGRVSGMKPLPAALPLAVITALKPCPPEREFTCRDPRALAIWRELHDEWFARSTNGIHIVSAQTGHEVINDRPQLILQAVKFVLDQARTSKR